MRGGREEKNKWMESDMQCDREWRWGRACDCGGH